MKMMIVLKKLKFPPGYFLSILESIHKLMRYMRRGMFLDYFRDQEKIQIRIAERVPKICHRFDRDPGYSQEFLFMGSRI